MANVLNLVQYQKQAYAKKAMFIYRGTAALKRGYGMCFDLDYYTSTSGEAVTDSFGGRGLKEIQIPSSSNNTAFAGVLTQDHPANPNGLVRKVELALPGACAMIAQAATSAINAGLLTCAVCEDDSGNTTLANGLFGYGGFRGKGSAVPLTTLAVAVSGDIPMQEITGVSVSVYNSSTGITTITSATGTPGTNMGYGGTTIDITDYEFVVWGGADQATSTAERCPSGVYPVLQATAGTVFTVRGDTGDGALTGTLRKKNLLRLAYLCDGDESCLCSYYVPETNADTEPIILGFTIVLGGLLIASDCNGDVPDGTIDGQRFGAYMLGTLGSSEMKFDITSGYTLSGNGIAGGLLETIEFDDPGNWFTMTWHQFGPAGTTYGAWQVDGVDIATNTLLA